MDQETVDEFEDRVLNKRAAKVCIMYIGGKRITEELANLTLSVINHTNVLAPLPYEEDVRGHLQFDL